VSASLGHFTAVRDAVAHRPPSRALADALVGRASALQDSGQIPESVGEARGALVLAQELKYPVAETMALDLLIQAAWLSGDPYGAVQLAQQAEQIPADIPGTLVRLRSGILAEALVQADDLAAAGRVSAARLARSQDAGDLGEPAGLAGADGVLGPASGPHRRRRRTPQRALQIELRAGLRMNLLDALDLCGHLCAQTGRHAEAVTMWAARAAVLRQAGIADLPVYARRRHNPLRRAQQELGPARARAAEERGAAMNLDAAAEYALMLTTPAPQAPTAESGGAKLSAREKELVILVAQGRTDAQIAAQLYISVRTVSSHLDRIRDKTGCRRRADLTRLALTTHLI
jgi:DNA-binding CsgD family transcriptional regulator